MRTTLSLDDDVARLLARLRRGRSLRGLVNEALRLGLRQLAAPTPRTTPPGTREADLGRCLMPSVDDVQEVLAVAEGERAP
jgi:hypothetical protein